MPHPHPFTHADHKHLHEDCLECYTERIYQLEQERDGLLESVATLTWNYRATLAMRKMVASAPMLGCASCNGTHMIECRDKETGAFLGSKWCPTCMPADPICKCGHPDSKHPLLHDEQVCSECECESFTLAKAYESLGTPVKRVNDDGECAHVQRWGLPV